MHQADFDPGKIRLSRSVPNPNGAADTRLYLISGAPPERPIEQIEWAAEISPTEQQRITQPAESLPHLLQLMHFNDLHGRLTNFSKDQCEPVISRMAAGDKSYP
jgi:hypothetical protein